MGRENCGRRGLSPAIVTRILRLLARPEALNNRQIAERVGVSHETVRKLRRGEHRTQTGPDRRGADPRKIRLALRMLDRTPRPKFARIARRVGLSRRVVQLLARGEHITQRGLP
jgi:DNA-binding Lrp family transcriptional regulator